MRTYGQYCPIARAAELFAERWTPLIVRNIHAGWDTYGEILAGAPGLSHTLLTLRLRHLMKAGIITTAPKASGPGVRYILTDAGKDLWPVLLELGAWGERWVELRDEHTNPRFLLWTWATTYLAHANLPDRRVVVRLGGGDHGGLVSVHAAGAGHEALERAHARRIITALWPLRAQETPCRRSDGCVEVVQPIHA